MNARFSGAETGSDDLSGTSNEEVIELLLSLKCDSQVKEGRVATSCLRQVGSAL